MSKFGDKIRRVTRPEAQPMGFVTSRATPDATMVLAAQAKDANAAADMAAKGADVVIVEAGGSQTKAPDAAEAICGARCNGSGDAKALREGGFDFMIFDPDKTASTDVLDEEIGYVMKLPGDISEVELRAVETFQLDAIDVGKVDAALTVRKQIDLRRITALTRKPLMAGVPADISTGQLQALRDTNVTVVVAGDAGAVEKLRKTIDALPPRARPKGEDRPTPFVPRTMGAEDEGDDDDGHEH